VTTPPLELEEILTGQPGPADGGRRPPWLPRRRWGDAAERAGLRWLRWSHGGLGYGKLARGCQSLDDLGCGDLIDLGFEIVVDAAQHRVG